ncbi:MAG: DUF1501 domain-containing protein, partial [Planctomycetota bacterium]|nr:DUF1501 domain-containing protein [Planctomycetota bacterium]
MLQKTACGFGSVALSALMADESLGAREELDEGRKNYKDPLAPKKSHFRPRVEHVIYLYMDGGPSQVDTWDPKPRLKTENGKPFSMKI